MDLLERRRQMMRTQNTHELVFCSYLYFDGTAYIDTDIIPPENATYVWSGGGETLEAAQKLFAVGSTNGSYISLQEGNSTNSTNRIFDIFYNSSSSVGTKTLWQYYQGYGIALTPNNLIFGDSATAFTKGSTSPNGAITIGYNASHSGQPYTGVGMGYFRVYGQEAQNEVTQSNITSNYTPIITLRPCTYDGKAGLWHVQQNRFYGNSAGSGIIYPCTRLQVYPSSKVNNYSYHAISSVSNAYTAYSATSRCDVNMTRGANAETYVYFKFDTSSIPNNATIISVFCTVKCAKSNNNANNIASTSVRLYSGTSAKGTGKSMSGTSATIYKISAGTWTREELQDIRIRLYGKRGTSNVNTNYYLYFYGATLHVYYTV